MRTAKATAHSNIALVKYWGKRAGVPRELNLPAVGSLSMTLDRLWTETELAPAATDRFELDGVEPGGEVFAKVVRHLDRLWDHAGKSGPRPRAHLRSHNHLPTAAGLASSASGLCALTLAAAAAFELALSPAQLSALARQGSGSAARSLWGGLVRLDRGERADGSDCVARPLAAASHWDLRLVVVQTHRGAKKLGSTEGMERSRETSPYYSRWVETSEADLDLAEDALQRRDLAALGAVVEHSCFKMHACMMASTPAVLYWNAATLAVIQAVWSAREEGVPGFVTIDAGPHVKVLCAVADAETIATRMRELAGVTAVDVCAPGPDAAVEVLP